MTNILNSLLSFYCSKLAVKKKWSHVSQLKVLHKVPKQQHGGYMKVHYTLRDYLISMPVAEGVLKLDTIR